MVSGVMSDGMKADPPGYLWSKNESFLKSGCRDTTFEKLLMQYEGNADDQGDYNSSPCTRAKNR